MESNQEWIEQIKKSQEAFYEDKFENKNNIEVVNQRTSYVNHKCSYCNHQIDSGKSLTRETTKIFTPYSENPIYKSKYFCNEEEYKLYTNNPQEPKGPKNPNEKKEPKTIIPEGFEIVNG